MKKNTESCPCGSGKMLTSCCQPYINAEMAAPTAEALMRSRYSAYALGNEQYLLDSWHVSTRPKHIDADPGAQWIRLKIIEVQFDRVQFIATYRLNGKAYKLSENSCFVLDDGKWFYLSYTTQSNG
jgi:SEC-C motif-containing protein